MTFLAGTLLRVHNYRTHPEGSIEIGDRFVPWRSTSRYEYILPLTNLLAHLLSVPSTSSQSPTPSEQSPKIEVDIVASPTTLLIGKAVFGELECLGDGLVTKCMEACLTIVDGVYAKWNVKESVRLFIILLLSVYQNLLPYS